MGLGPLGFHPVARSPKCRVFPGVVPGICVSVDRAGARWEGQAARRFTLSPAPSSSSSRMSCSGWSWADPIGVPFLRRFEVYCTNRASGSPAGETGGCPRGLPEHEHERADFVTQIDPFVKGLWSCTYPQKTPSPPPKTPDGSSFPSSTTTTPLPRNPPPACRAYGSIENCRACEPDQAF